MYLYKKDTYLTLYKSQNKLYMIFANNEVVQEGSIFIKSDRFEYNFAAYVKRTSFIDMGMY